MSGFSLNGHQFQAALALARKKVLVRYNPYDLSFVQVHHEGERYDDAVLLEVPEHIDFHAQQSPASPEQPPKSGLNLLSLLQKEQQQEKISFVDLNKKKTGEEK